MTESHGPCSVGRNLNTQPRRTHYKQTGRNGMAEVQRLGKKVRVVSRTEETLPKVLRKRKKDDSVHGRKGNLS